MSFRSRTLLNAAEGQACQICGSTSTTVACHANSVALGKGTGIKVSDYYVAWLCDHHHALYDGRAGKLTKQEKTELWTTAYLRTVAQWFKLGIVRVQPHNKIEAPMNGGISHTCQSCIQDGRFLGYCGQPAVTGQANTARCAEHATSINGIPPRTPPHHGGGDSTITGKTMQSTGKST